MIYALSSGRDALLLLENYNEVGLFGQGTGVDFNLSSIPYPLTSFQLDSTSAQGVPVLCATGGKVTQFSATVSANSGDPQGTGVVELFRCPESDVSYPSTFLAFNPRVFLTFEITVVPFVQTIKGTFHSTLISQDRVVGLPYFVQGTGVNLDRVSVNATFAVQ